MARFWHDASDHRGKCPNARMMLKLLSQQQPLELLQCLLEGEHDVTQLAERVELEMAQVSRTLKTMHSYLLVEVKTIRTRHVYRLGQGVTIRQNNGAFALEVTTREGGLIAVTLPADTVRDR